jgi:CheY-like chemotaxis protein
VVLVRPPSETAIALEVQGDISTELYGIVLSGTDFAALAVDPNTQEALMSDLATTVLSVDDDRSNLRLLETILEDQGFKPHSVHDSRDAIAEIYRVNPDVVLLDIMMPHLNGYEVAEQIRNEPALQDLLVIAVSTLNGEEHDRQCAGAGIDCQLTKPVDKDELEWTIRAGLRQRRP